LIIAQFTREKRIKTDLFHLLTGILKKHASGQLLDLWWTHKVDHFLVTLRAWGEARSGARRFPGALRLGGELNRMLRMNRISRIKGKKNRRVRVDGASS
jgi:hypothetical protein